jgi:hypothetical protein
VALFRDEYVIRIGDQTLLRGTVRDYTRHGGFPYQTPNFLFLGDNTTSARARFDLGSVEVEHLDLLDSSEIFAVGVRPAYAALYLSRGSGLHPNATMAYLRNRADDYPARPDGTYDASLVKRAEVRLRKMMASASPEKKKAVNRRAAARVDPVVEVVGKLGEMTPERLAALLESAPAALASMTTMAPQEPNVVHQGIKRLEDWDPSMLGATAASKAQGPRGDENQKAKPTIQQEDTSI